MKDGDLSIATGDLRVWKDGSWWPVHPQWSLDVIAEKDALIAELRAVLKPLLVDPFPGSDEDALPCIFCRWSEHDFLCPVLRRAHLLGEEA